MTTLSPVTDRDRNDGVPTIQVTVSPWVVASIEPIGRDITLGGAKIAPNEIDWDRYHAIGGTFRAHRSSRIVLGVSAIGAPSLHATTQKRGAAGRSHRAEHLNPMGQSMAPERTPAPPSIT